MSTVKAISIHLTLIGILSDYCVYSVFYTVFMGRRYSTHRIITCCYTFLYRLDYIIISMRCFPLRVSIAYTLLPFGIVSALFLYFQWYPPARGLNPRTTLDMFCQATPVSLLAWCRDTCSAINVSPSAVY